MATVVAPAHRQHALGLRICEDIAIVVVCATVGWLLVASVVLRPFSWRDTLLLPVLVADPSAEGRPMSVVAASRPMMAAVAAATALEERGEFGPETAAAWRRAVAECRRLSMEPIAHRGGASVMLWLLEGEQERAVELAALIASPATPASAVEGLAALRVEALANAEIIRARRDIVNFDHWRVVCEAGPSAAGLAARRAAWLANQAAITGRWAESKAAYEESFEAWHTVLDEHPAMLDDTLVIEDLAEQVGRYRAVLDRLDSPMPTPFILQDVVTRNASSPL